jgi:hypothetical protein
METEEIAASTHIRKTGEKARGGDFERSLQIRLKDIRVVKQLVGLKNKPSFVPVLELMPLL